jgi:pyridoxine 5-phosphate synthase
MSETNILLGVNVDHVATLRQARYRDCGRTCGQVVEPDPVAWALAAERAGADGITMHLREDRRHMQDADARRMRESIATRLNLEMACNDAILAFALELGPDYACLVPENRAEVTTEGGLDVAGRMGSVGRIVEPCSPRTSLRASSSTRRSRRSRPRHSSPALHRAAHGRIFQRMAPALRTRSRAAPAGTRRWPRPRTRPHRQRGHGINYVNVGDIVAIEGLHELNIGHSIVSRAVTTGVDEAVRRMKTLIRGQA